MTKEEKLYQAIKAQWKVIKVNFSTNDFYLIRGDRLSFHITVWTTVGDNVNMLVFYDGVQCGVEDGTVEYIVEKIFNIRTEYDTQ